MSRLSTKQRRAGQRRRRARGLIALRYERIDTDHGFPSIVEWMKAVRDEMIRGLVDPRLVKAYPGGYP